MLTFVVLLDPRHDRRRVIGRRICARWLVKQFVFGRDLTPCLRPRGLQHHFPTDVHPTCTSCEQEAYHGRVVSPDPSIAFALCSSSTGVRATSTRIRTTVRLAMRCPPRHAIQTYRHGLPRSRPQDCLGYTGRSSRTQIHMYVHVLSIPRRYSIDSQDVG